MRTIHWVFVLGVALFVSGIGFVSAAARNSREVAPVEAPFGQEQDVPASPTAMLDPWFLWIESSAFSVWVTQSPSLLAFPGILAAHTIGLGLLAGLNAALDFRLLGVARDIPTHAFTRFLPVMWFGLWLNVLSGIALLLAYPTKALTNPVFYLKLTLIAVALVILRSMLRRTATPAPAPAPGVVKVLAVASLVSWVGAITAGRLLAYTCTRLTVDLGC